MKTSTLSAVLAFALLSAVGCAKTTDLGKMQEETIAVVKIYITELDVLQRRYDELAADVKTLPPDAKDRLNSAEHAIREGRTLAASAPTTVATAGKSGKADELIATNDHIIATLVVNIATAKDDLAAVEASTGALAYRSPTATPVPPAPPTPTPTSTNIPCEAEIALQCPEGQIDACTKQPEVGGNHVCVPK